MQKDYLYKSRVSLLNFDLLFTLIISVLGFVIHPILGLCMLFIFFIHVINAISNRIFVYEDRIEYKIGFFLKTSSKMMPLRNISVINCSCSIFGKILNYGDIFISTYDRAEGINIKNVKNAKMLTENIKTLIMSEKNK